MLYILRAGACGANRFFKNIFGATAGAKTKQKKKSTMPALFFVFSYDTPLL
jgi:hypothetical protein